MALSAGCRAPCPCTAQRALSAHGVLPLAAAPCPLPPRPCRPPPTG